MRFLVVVMSVLIGVNVVSQMASPNMKIRTRFVVNVDLLSMTKRYVVIEHIKLGRDIYHDPCEECPKCDGEIEVAYNCDCDCHVEIREQQKIVVESDTEEEADEKASKLCTLTIVGDSDIIDCGLAANQDKIGIIHTHSETYKSYD